VLLKNAYPISQHFFLHSSFNTSPLRSPANQLLNQATSSLTKKKQHKAETETAMILVFWAIVNFVLEHFND
jgi:beta-lactamase regulating signal transducer with metallopeptidase domain